MAIFGDFHRSKGLHFRVLAQWLLTGTLVAAVLSGCGGGGTAPVAPPVIVTPPQASIVLEGASATFSVLATGQAPLAYRWQKNGVTLVGATTDTYSTPALGLADSGAQYAVQVSNAGGAVVSAAATVTVKPRLPSIAVQPADQTALRGMPFSFAVQAAGSEPLQFQWYRAGVALPGETGSVLRVPAAAYADDGVAYRVQVSNPGGTLTSQWARVKVAPDAAPTVVSTCREITASGSYVLDRDLQAGQYLVDCLKIHDTSQVQLDCAGHQILQNEALFAQAGAIERVDNFSIKNCLIDSMSFNVLNSSRGSVHNNQLQNSGTYKMMVMNTLDSQAVAVDSNRVDGVIQGWNNSHWSVSNNQITNRNSVLQSCQVVINFGAHARIFDNNLNGGWDGSAATGLIGTRLGADDGMCFSDTDDIRIENNTIRNSWDCGIESVGTVTNAVIEGNTISTVGCGIGAWYYSSILNSIFRNNTVENSATLFQFQRVYGLRPARMDLNVSLPADKVVYFKDNLFEGNQFSRTAPTWPSVSYSATIPIFDNMGFGSVFDSKETVPTAADFQLSNNVFRNNQFGTELEPPWFGNSAVVPGYIIDGGGNVCRQPGNGVKNYPLVCNAR